MLRNVLIMSSSGLVLFSKEYAHSVAQPRLVGSLLTALLEFSTKSAGAPVCYMEFRHVAVTVATNDANNVFCAIFHDPHDGIKFSKLLAREVLGTFVVEHGEDISNIGHNMRTFDSFNNRLLPVISDCVRPILRTLHQQRGISMAILVADGVISYSTKDVDQIGVLANLQDFLYASIEMMSYTADGVSSMTVHSGRNTCIHVHRVEDDQTLVVLYRKGSLVGKNLVAIKECVGMLRSEICIRYSGDPVGTDVYRVDSSQQALLLVSTTLSCLTYGRTPLEARLEQKQVTNAMLFSW